MEKTDSKSENSREPKSVDEQMLVCQTELLRIARKKMARERIGHTLQPTALVGEVYLKLSKQSNLKGVSRTAFLAAAAQTMQRLLIDSARKVKNPKHGGDKHRMSLSDADPATADTVVDVLDLNDAMEKLRKKSSQMYAVVTYRFFAGMTMSEIAKELHVGLRKIEDDWAFARAWLRNELER